MPTSDDLMKLAHACAARLEVPAKSRRVPTFGDIEEQCESEYEELLQLLHEDEVFAPVDVEQQARLVEQIEAALPEDRRELLERLTDNQVRHVWLQQGAAHHAGLAVGMRLAAPDR